MSCSGISSATLLCKCVFPAPELPKLMQCNGFALLRLVKIMYIKSLLVSSPITPLLPIRSFVSCNRLGFFNNWIASFSSLLVSSLMVKPSASSWSSCDRRWVSSSLVTSCNVLLTIEVPISMRYATFLTSFSTWLSLYKSILWRSLVSDFTFLMPKVTRRLSKWLSLIPPRTDISKWFVVYS